MKYKLIKIFSSSNKKYLPFLLLLSSALVFSGIAINKFFLSDRVETEDTSTPQSTDTSIEADNEGGGKIAGVQNKVEESNSPASIHSKSILPSPTNKPDNKSDTNNQDSNNNSNTTNVIVVTATTVPTSTTAPTATPTAIPPTPTPDNRPFEANMFTAQDGDTINVTITANKNLKSCNFQITFYQQDTQSCGSISTNGATGSINGNVCTFSYSSPNCLDYVNVESTYGETKSF